jgi:hypothetical protein
MNDDPKDRVDETPAPGADMPATPGSEAPAAKEGHLEAPTPGAPGPDPNRLTPAWARFRSCRWRATPEDGEFCTHRDVLPYAGKEGFNPESWCPDCPYFKLKRVARKPSY